MTRQQSADTGQGQGDKVFYVPGPGGGMIRTTDPDVAKVACEEHHDSDHDNDSDQAADAPVDDWNPDNHPASTCWISPHTCTGCR